MMQSVCSANMMNYFKPENKYHSQYYKGWYIDVHGYKLIYKPSHLDARPDGYIFEHRLVMEARIGRRLKREEKVHHIDHNKLNNEPNNLKIFSSSEHAKEHKYWLLGNEKVRNGKFVRCLVCLKEHWRKGYSLQRAKKYFCSVNCYFLYRKQNKKSNL